MFELTVISAVVLCMKDNGEEGLEKAEVKWYGQMELLMRENGKTTELMVMAPSFTLLEMSMKGNGTETKLAGKEFIGVLILEALTMVIGKMIYNMVEELKLGLMEVSMKVNSI